MVIKDEEKGEEEVVTRFIYVDAKKPEPVLVAPSAGIQVEKEDSAFDDFIMVGQSEGDTGLTLFETLMVVGIAVIASCTVTIVIIKILGCKKEA